MVVAKHSKARSPGKKSLRIGRTLMRNDTSVKHLELTAAKKGFGKHFKTRRRAKTAIEKASGAQVVLEGGWARTLGGRPKTVRKVLAKLAVAARQAERSGKAVALTIEVPPSETEPVVASLPNDELDDALAAARRRGGQYVAEILKRPDMLSGRAFAELIGTSPETVNQKRKTGELLGLVGAARGVRFPTWQITDDGRLLPGLRSLFEILGNDPWTVYRFLIQRHNELAGATALGAMKAGRLEAVQDVARNLKAGVFA